MQLIDYEDYFVRGIPSPRPVRGLCGRILRGKMDEDFLTLTDEPENRKIVMMMDSEGLGQLLGKSGYECLITIGYEAEYIQHKVENMYRFKLVIFNESAFRPATWENVRDVVVEVYGDTIAPIIDAQLNALKTTPFDRIEKMGLDTMKNIDREGPDSELFMTVDRLLASNGTLNDVRLFLYNTVHLRELFAGDGYTYDEQGNRGLREFITPNRAITAFGPHKLIDMTVDLP